MTTLRAWRGGGGRRWMVAGLAILVFAWSFVYRYNDPEGNFAGLFDDHYFYLVRGWQMLFGDLPDRDFVDPGAPLTFALQALVQVGLGRGVWSEFTFCVAALSVASALTFVGACLVAGSIPIGLLAAFIQITLHPRFYNYPKVLVYAAAIPLIWRFMDRPGLARRLSLAAATAVALLLRHDHGAFVGLATMLAIALLPGLTPRAKVQQALSYAVLVVLMLSPYLAYLQVNGGVLTHVVTANSWAQRDRARAPLVLPYFSSVPRPDDDPPQEEPDWWQDGIFVQATRNYEPWLFWLAVALPLLVTGTLALSTTAFRPNWPHARRKVVVLVVLGGVLVAGFLRGRLSSRFGDVSVTMALLLAVLVRAASSLMTKSSGDRTPLPLRAMVALVAMVAIGGTLFTVFPSVWNRLDLDAMTERPLGAYDRLHVITQRLQTWPLETWAKPDDDGPMLLAFYLRDCTAPDDRVFISQYLPQVAALSQRAFAGGHGDLRPSFFTTAADQKLTISRLEHQRVPVVVMPGGGEFEGFSKDFPRIDAYLQTRYRAVGDFDIGLDSPIRLFVSRAAKQTGEYAHHQWPCFR